MGRPLRLPHSFLVFETGLEEGIQRGGPKARHFAPVAAPHYLRLDVTFILPGTICRRAAICFSISGPSSRLYAGHALRTFAPALAGLDFEGLMDVPRPFQPPSMDGLHFPGTSGV
jgi:hypothetical protein